MCTIVLILQMKELPMLKKAKTSIIIPVRRAGKLNFDSNNCAELVKLAVPIQQGQCQIAASYFVKTFAS